MYADTGETRCLECGTRFLMSMHRWEPPEVVAARDAENEWQAAYRDAVKDAQRENRCPALDVMVSGPPLRAKQKAELAQRFTDVLAKAFDQAGDEVFRQNVVITFVPVLFENVARGGKLATQEEVVGFHLEVSHRDGFEVRNGVSFMDRRYPLVRDLTEAMARVLGFGCVSRCTFTFRQPKEWELTRIGDFKEW
jgi:phenylpyruvate tautomerase PptA (4-oxalocrotonate tautomerase family)